MAEMPRKFRLLRENSDLQQEALAWQDQNLKTHFVDVPLALLARAIELKRKS
jgi:hypothetical protein